jgi:hypothetical protein
MCKDERPKSIINEPQASGWSDNFRKAVNICDEYLGEFLDDISLRRNGYHYPYPGFWVHR